ncbi:hypothetical protein JNUCC0626_13710 [Lentzea sp. JNUCC 0626]|uniref:hypothetical protein n=1 Tax=Lentzea sp. JNUCC 0626 TaxID=3367513 RepID=UPI0037484238
MGRMTPQQREAYENGVNVVRRIANCAPRFKVVERDGETVIVDGRLEDSEMLLRVEPGLQAERVVEFFNYVGCYFLLDVVGLLEDARGTNAESKAVELLVRMHLPAGPLECWPRNRTPPCSWRSVRRASPALRATTHGRSLTLGRCPRASAGNLYGSLLIASSAIACCGSSKIAMRSRTKPLCSDREARCDVP